MTRKSLVAGAAAAIALAATLGSGAIAAPGSSSGNDLAGTWVATVNRPAPLPPLTSLQIFTSSGGVIETANESPASRTAAYGAWERVEGRLYSASALFFRFDPQTGAHVRTQKIDRTIRLSQDGQTFVQVARATMYDLDGNVLSTARVVGTGERLQVDRIPDEP
jgi:hypothetical protein